jgi:putative signal transducing protein
MREILKSNNVVELNFAEVVLKDAGIPSVVLDSHMSIMDGSMVILPRRLMVDDSDEARAQAILKDALASHASWT